MSKPKTLPVGNGPAGQPKPPVIRAVLDHPPSSDPERVVVRIEGITYSLASAAAAEAFRAKYAGRPHHGEGFEN
jgi:hypothetical protein